MHYIYLLFSICSITSLIGMEKPLVKNKQQLPEEQQLIADFYKKLHENKENIDYYTGEKICCNNCTPMAWDIHKYKANNTNFAIGVSLCTNGNIHYKSKHHIISIDASNKKYKTVSASPYGIEDNNFIFVAAGEKKIVIHNLVEDIQTYHIPSSNPKAYIATTAITRGNTIGALVETRADDDSIDSRMLYIYDIKKKKSDAYHCSNKGKCDSLSIQSIEDNDYIVVQSYGVDFEKKEYFCSSNPHITNFDTELFLPSDNTKSLAVVRPFPALHAYLSKNHITTAEKELLKHMQELDLGIFLSFYFDKKNKAQAAGHEIYSALLNTCLPTSLLDGWSKSSLLAYYIPDTTDKPNEWFNLQEYLFNLQYGAPDEKINEYKLNLPFTNHNNQSLQMSDQK